MSVSDVTIHNQVKEYYGQKVKKREDLKLQACTVSFGSGHTKEVKEALASVHEEVSKKYYGCGLVIPECLEGRKILDLGSGSGLDCFTLSKLVGPGGHIVGIDMTDEQLSVANEYIDYHTNLYGYKKPNVKFVKGYIERLMEAGLEENFFDIIISNCVINLSTDKNAVLSQSHKVLKVGGEMFFGDIYADRVVSEEARKHPDLWGECISGALYWKDLHKIAESVGFSQPRIISVKSIPVEREDFKKILGDVKFASVIYRLFKLPPNCNESSAQAIYNGDISGHENQLKFDHKLVFKANDPVCIDGVTHASLKYSRFADEFLIRTQKCGESKAESELENPFEILENLKSSGKEVSAVCCSTKCC